jgi:hypothetical protein
MNFKNISLFAMLFAAGFVGTVANADSRKEYLQEKLELRDLEMDLFIEERKALEVSREGWEALENKIRSYGCAEEHFESSDAPDCLGARFVRLHKNGKSGEISSLDGLIERHQYWTDKVKKELADAIAAEQED